MRALLLLAPAPLPEERGIPAEDWHQTPTSVRHHFLSLLKRVETLEARCNQDSSNASRPPSTESPRKSANDGCQLPSVASLAPTLAILAILRCSWSRPHRCRCGPMRVAVALRSSRRSPAIIGITSLHDPLFILKYPIGGGTKVAAWRVVRYAKRRCPRSIPVETAPG